LSKSYESDIISAPSLSVFRQPLKKCVSSPISSRIF